MNLLPIRLNTLVYSKKLGFDVYLKLSHKNILYIRAEDEIAPEQYDRLQQKKLKKVYIKTEDELAYQNFVDQTFLSINTIEEISDKEKGKIIFESICTKAEEVLKSPGTIESFNEAQKLSQNIHKVLSENKALLGNMLATNSKVGSEERNDAERIVDHCSRSASLVISFGMHLGLKASDVKMLGLSALYHDSAFLSCDEDTKKHFFLDIKKSKMLPGFTTYLEHPKKAAEVLQDKSFITPEILDLIATHEEKLNGQGFPKKLVKLSPLEEIHSLICHYDREVSCLNRSMSEVNAQIMVELLGLYDLELLKKFADFMQNKSVL